MMLRSVHMAKWQRHQLAQDPDRIFGRLCQTNTHDRVDSLRVTVIAYVMSSLTASSASLFFSADGAFHLNLAIKIFQRRAADQTFVFHTVFLQSDGGIALLPTDFFYYITKYDTLQFLI